MTRGEVWGRLAGVGEGPRGGEGALTGQLRPQSGCLLDTSSASFAFKTRTPLALRPHSPHLHTVHTCCTFSVLISFTNYSSASKCKCMCWRRKPRTPHPHTIHTRCASSVHMSLTASSTPSSRKHTRWMQGTACPTSPHCSHLLRLQRTHVLDELLRLLVHLCQRDAERPMPARNGLLPRHKVLVPGEQTAVIKVWALGYYHMLFFCYTGIHGSSKGASGCCRGRPAALHTSEHQLSTHVHTFC